MAKGNDKKLQFYSQCAAAGLTDVSTEAAMARAELIAQKIGCGAIGDYAAYFAEGREQYLSNEAEKERRERKEALDAKRREETELSKQYTRYSTLYGRDKRVKMLTDKRLEYLEQAKNARSGADALIRSTQQKEIDWATHGGIASGIAGGAAGLAVAMDAQARNADIRAQNAANLQAFAPVFTAAYSSASSKQNTADSYIPKIEEAKLKLVGREGAAELMPHLHFKDVKVTGSETGALIVEAKVAQDNDVRIFGSLPGVIDGTVIAKIHKKGEDKPVASAVMVFPVDGAERETTLHGIAAEGGEEGAEYTVEFDSNNMWAMERYKSVYTLPAMLYSKRSPVIIQSGTMYDNGRENGSRSFCSASLKKT